MRRETRRSFPHFSSSCSSFHLGLVSAFKHIAMDGISYNGRVPANYLHFVMKLDLIDKPTHFMFTSLLVIKSIYSSKKKFNLFYTFIIFTYFH